MTLDAHEIAPGLWQGSMPYAGRIVANAGFDTVVFCASDYQPSPADFPGVEVLLAPFDDDNTLDQPSLRIAVKAASQVAARLAKKKRVLVTCVAGINRSGLVVALALHKLHGYSGRRCIELVRQGRKLRLSIALRNPAFVEALMKLAGEESPTPPGLPPVRVR